MNRKPLAYDPCPEDFARWGYAEANRNADDAEANGKIIGYDLAVAELKARDAQIHELLHCALNELPAGDCHQTIYWINKALLLLEKEEAKT